jgi:signal peptidase I
VKRGDIMVNENFDKFRQEQKEHRSEYLGGNRKQKPGLNDAEYNNQSITDKAPGATGRDI